MTSFQDTERDLLVRISERVEVLVTAVSKLEANMSTKADTVEVNDLKKRVTSLEKRNWMVAGGLVVAEAIFKFWVK